MCNGNSEEWVEVMSKTERKRRAIEEEKYRIEEERRQLKKEREIEREMARKKALDEISKALSSVHDLQKEQEKHAIRLISPKTFENRLTRGGKRVNQKDIEARHRVSEIMSYMRRVKEKEEKQEKIQYLRHLMQKSKPEKVLQWESIVFNDPVEMDQQQIMEDSVLRCLEL